jgi:hypothetical protein
MGETESIVTSAAPPAISRSTFPRRHRPNDPSMLQHDIHFTKYCEDIGPQNHVTTNHGTSISMDCKYGLYPSSLLHFYPARCGGIPPCCCIVCFRCSRGHARRPCSPRPPTKVCFTSPPSPRKKEATVQATHRGDGCLRESKFVTRGPTKLAKPPVATSVGLIGIAGSASVKLVNIKL